MTEPPATSTTASTPVLECETDDHRRVALRRDASKKSVYYLDGPLSNVSTLQVQYDNNNGDYYYLGGLQIVLLVSLKGDTTTSNNNNNNTTKPKKPCIQVWIDHDQLLMTLSIVKDKAQCVVPGGPRRVTYLKLVVWDADGETSVPCDIQHIRFTLRVPDNRPATQQPADSTEPLSPQAPALPSIHASLPHAGNNNDSQTTAILLNLSQQMTQLTTAIQTLTTTVQQHQQVLQKLVDQQQQPEDDTPAAAAATKTTR